jgi:hypothetical protein
VNHEELFIGSHDEGADGGDGRSLLGSRVATENFDDAEEIGRDVVGQRALKFFKRIVARKDGAGADVAVVGGFDVMFHITDEKSFVGSEVVFLEDGVDGFAFIDDAGVSLAKEVFHLKALGLMGKIVGMDGAEEKGGELMGSAVLKNLFGAKEEGDGVVVLAKLL